MGAENYFDSLKKKMDEYAHLVYKLSKSFPKSELYGITSQIRRAALSVILNFIEGYARQKQFVKLNFWEISYGSLKESKYLLHFCLVEELIDKTDYEQANKRAEEIGAMLWSAMKSIKQSNN